MFNLLLLSNVSNHLQCEMSVVYHEMSLSVGQSDSVIQILYTICDSGGESCLLHDICNLTGLPKQTINSAIRKLEQEHILYLESTGSRNKRVILTEKGKQLPQRRLEKSSLLKIEFLRSGDLRKQKNSSP